MLGGQAIVDRQHGDVQLIDQRGAEPVAIVQVAEHPAAAVKIERQGQALVIRRIGRAIQAHGSRPARQVRHDVPGPHQRRRQAQHGARRRHSQASVGKGQLIKRRPSRSHDQIDDRLGVSVDLANRTDDGFDHARVAPRPGSHAPRRPRPLRSWRENSSPRPYGQLRRPGPPPLRPATCATRWPRRRRA